MSDETLLTSAATATPATPEATPAPNDAANGDAVPANDAAAAGADAANKTDAGAAPVEGAEGDQNSNADGEGAEAEADEGVPESYSLKPPEGYEDLDTVELAAITPVAKELGLSNAKLQKLADAYAPLVTARVEAALQQSQEAIFENHRNQVSQWVDAVKADKELGGADFQKKIGRAALTLERFGTPELREFLSETKLGSHPEMVRLCFNISKQLIEDGGLVRGAPTGGGKPKSDAEVFFPDLTKT